MIYLGSAPGTLMLFGEHAVLRGKQAICCAVNQRIHVSLLRVKIQSFTCTRY